MILSELIKYVNLCDSDFDIAENKQKNTLAITSGGIMFNFEKNNLISIEKDGAIFVGKEISSFFNMKAFW